MNCTKINNEDGLTLLEVMVAVVILSLSLLMLLNMTMVALNGNDWANKTTVSTQAIQAKLEELRASASPSSGYDMVGEMHRQWTVDQAGPNLLSIQIHCSWTSIAGREQADSMVTFLKP